MPKNPPYGKMCATLKSIVRTYTEPMSTSVVGQTLNGRYRVDNKIGGGAVATVYSGTDLQTGKTVAIKQLLDTAKQADDAQIERFERESQAMEDLSHPNIVNVYDTIFLDRDHFIVMEHVDGGTVTALVSEDNPPAVETVLQIAHDIASAMVLVHDQNIIHRDIKPDNILLTREGRAKLTDFGMARFTYMARLTQRDMMVGSMMYMAPEQFKTGEAVKESDIWQYGVTLYELLTGRKPFSKPHLIVTVPHDSVSKVRSDVPADVSAFIDQLLEKNPRQRLRDFEDVIDELDTLMS